MRVITKLFSIFASILAICAGLVYLFFASAIIEGFTDLSFWPSVFIASVPLVIYAWNLHRRPCKPRAQAKAGGENPENPLGYEETRSVIKSTERTMSEPENEPIGNFDYEVDPLLEKAVNIVMDTGWCSISLIQRRLKCEYSLAARLVDQMEGLGIVGPFSGNAPRELLITREQWEDIKLVPSKNMPPMVDVEQIVKDEKAWLREQRGLSPLEDELRRIDSMDGHMFERWCADLLEFNGFENVEVTRGSNDQGVDIVAENHGIKYAVQCKCYSSDLGNKAIQEVNAGKYIYRCNVGAVMTNRHFTDGGREAAAATGTLLWDRETLISMMNRNFDC